MASDRLRASGGAIAAAAIAAALPLCVPAPALGQLIDYVDFTAAASNQVGQRPNAIAVADLNGDTRPDVITGNHMSGDLSVLLGQGGGAFGTATSFAGGPSGTYTGGIESIAVGEFNADANPDLAVANSSFGNVTVFLGTAGGGFASGTGYATGSYASAIAVADFNGDNHPDLAVANYGDDTVSVLAGADGGSFGAPTNFGTGDGPRAIAVGDFNRDADPDLAVANVNSGNVSVLLGATGATFGSATSFATGAGPSAAVLGDFNGDGDPDLASASGGPQHGGFELVSVLLGGGGGTFTHVANYPAGERPAAIAAGDFNGDSDLDLVVTNTSKTDATSGGVAVLLGGDGASFGEPFKFATGADPRAVAVGDFNGDSAPDLAVADGANNVSVLLNKPVDRTTPPTAALAIKPDTALVSQVVSFDASGSVELPGRRITRYEWDLDGDGSFETDTGADPTATRSYPAPQEINAGLRITNQLGLSAETRKPLSIRPIPPPGVVGISINNGEIATNEPAVTLSLVWPPLAKEALISNDGGFGIAGSAQTFAVAPTQPWTLASSGPERLPKIAYVRFLGAGSDLITYTDDIILDQRPPEMQGATTQETPPATPSAAALKRRPIRIRARDENSGLALAEFARTKRGKRVGVRLSAPNTRGRRRLNRVVAVRSSFAPRYVRVRDAAGNYSGWRPIRLR